MTFLSIMPNKTPFEFTYYPLDLKAGIPFYSADLQFVVHDLIIKHINIILRLRIGINPL